MLTWWHLACMTAFVKLTKQELLEYGFRNHISRHWSFFYAADRVFGIIEKKLRRNKVILKPTEISDIISEKVTLRKIGTHSPVCDWKTAVKDNDCPLWHELRYGRITASKAYDAAHCNTFDGTLTETILGASKLRDTEAMKRGRLLESQVLKEVEKICKIKINKCGLKLNTEYPIMGASPDGESSVYSIEIKSEKDGTICQFRK
ncbi:unnamed protein product [Diatraea saccharalis]|uniref:YqaJ viral recombinase domain-containing protein n=1 Tax=Diatraea saccharalis TaxID=40085 RepID=A0A9N9RB22_9NEOP|nr:unnamed protein product [Diatraea saccharalis]